MAEKPKVPGIGRRLLSLMAVAWISAATGWTAQTNIYYVDANSLTPQFPYDAPEKAATGIVEAVTEAQANWNPDTNFVVLVTDGTYSLTSSITITKPITVVSVNGRDSTFVDGGYPGRTNRCFYIAANATLNGFTISNGYAFGASPNHRGGGIYAYACTALVQNCDIVMNRASLDTGGNGCGGGMAMTDGATMVSNCLIAQNSTLSDGNGTGLYVYNCRSRVVDSVISNNVQTGNNGTGAGIAVMSSVNTIVSNCVMIANSCSRYGANYTDAGTFTHCLFTNNYARSSGGGVTLHTSTTGARLLYSTVVRNRSGGEGGGGVAINRGTIHNSQIIYNYTSDEGGGVSINEGYLKNCLVAGNTAGGTGGGLSKSANPQTIYNCTIVRNSAGAAGGGIYSLTTNIPNLYVNNIICSNQAAGNPNDIASSVGNWRDNFSYCCSADLVAGVNGNITADPLFVYPGSGCGTNAVLGNYILYKTSPCEDTGLNQSWMTTTPTNDLAGYARILPAVDGIVNMGAYEFTLPLPGTVIVLR